MRLGDYEFLCATFGETLANARLRFESVRAALADDPYPCEIEVGLAALAPGDSVEGFIERAGAALPSASRHWRVRTDPARARSRSCSKADATGSHHARRLNLCGT